MSAQVPEAPPTSRSSPGSSWSGKYNAFISYSHYTDDALAPKIQGGMEQLAKRWNERRALNVFLDKTDLGANHSLDEKLKKSLDGAEWFVFLASEASADSKWCNEEVKWWLDNRTPEKMLFILTGGQLEWEPTATDIVNWETSTAEPEALRGRLSKEPTYIDMRWARDEIDLLNVRDHAVFRDAISQVAAPIHRKGSPKELVADDLTQFNKSKRLRRLAIVGLVILTLAAALAAIAAVASQREALKQRDAAASRALAGDASRALANDAIFLEKDAEIDLAALLALEAVRRSNTTDAIGSLLAVVGSPTRFQQRTREHSVPVRAISIDPNSPVAASGDDEGTIIIWDLDPTDPDRVATPREARIEFGDGVPVDQLVFGEQDGSTLLTAISPDGMLVIYDIANGEEFYSDLSPRLLEVTAISSDLHTVAGPIDGYMEIRRDFEIVNEIPIPDLVGDSQILDITFSPDDDFLAWSDDHGFVYIWDWQFESEAELLMKRATAVRTLAFSPDGSVLAAGEEEGNINLYDFATGNVGEVSPQPVNAVTDLSFDPAVPAADPERGVLLASAHRNGEIALWNVSATFGFEVDRLLGHNEATFAVAFGSDGQVASGSFDGEVLWWAARPGANIGQRLPESAPFHESVVVALGFIDDATIASADLNGTVLFLDLESGQSTNAFDGETAHIWALDATAGTLAIGYGDGTIKVIPSLDQANPDESPPLELEGGHDVPVHLISLSPDGSALGSVFSDGTVVVWDLTTGQPVATLALPDEFEHEAVLHPGGDTLWVGGRDEGGQPAALRIDIASMSITGRILHGTSRDSVDVIAQSPDGSMLATAGTDRKIHLWNPEGLGKLEGSLIGHRDVITGLTFTVDGQNIVSSDGDLVVLLWDVEERSVIGALGGPTDGITDLALSPDQKTVAVSSEDGEVYTWTLDSDEWVRRACVVAGRNMTEDEWDLFGNGQRQRHCPFDDGAGPVVEYEIDTFVDE